MISTAHIITNVHPYTLQAVHGLNLSDSEDCSRWIDLNLQGVAGHHVDSDNSTVLVVYVADDDCFRPIDPRWQPSCWDDLNDGA